MDSTFPPSNGEGGKITTSPNGRGFRENQRGSLRNNGFDRHDVPSSSNTPMDQSFGNPLNFPKYPPPPLLRQFKEYMNLVQQQTNPVQSNPPLNVRTESVQFQHHQLVQV